jgi:DNA-binding beta-propeller fold protein YncE
MDSQITLRTGGLFLLALLVIALFSWQRASSFQLTAARKPAVVSSAARPGAGTIAPVSRRPLGGDIEPETTVADPYPTFNGITLDTENNRVVMTDLNRHGILMYDRTAKTEPGEPTTALRHIIGPATEMGFVAGVAVDPEKREIFAAENDAWGIRVFSYDDQGNARPRRILASPHQVWGLSLSRSRKEIAASVEELDAIVVYRQDAEKLDPPIRTIRGEKTGLADPHGIYLDGVNNEIFVANHGSWTKYMPNTSHDPLPPVIPVSAGHTELPSIQVYPAMASGDVKPIRTIQGEQTGLDWPMQVDFDAAHNELAVANFGKDSIAIFHRTDEGDVAPARIIRGPHTGIVGPIGVNIDAKNDEIWVANYGDHTAVVFPRNAEGDVAPKRIIRNAPENTPTCGFTDASAATYDSKRKQVLVAN